ncbi:MAG: acetolactate synthase small subunit [Lactobacillales bacterium]|jgi:acetolactate synthase-1/3 small subunit|nr:acetolactate synthase small subunit [Lactobacillales bacterium]
MRRIITALVNNNPGLLNRYSGVLSRRQVNIESITIGPSIIDGKSRITIVITVDDLKESEQVIKQLNKQIDIIKVADITDESHIERELALIKINAKPGERSEIFTVIEPFRAQVVDVGARTVVVQVAGTSEKVDAFLELVAPYGVKQVARTGVTGFLRGSKN